MRRGATATSPPSLTISGDYTDLTSPGGIALDSAGNIYVTDYGAACLSTAPLSATCTSSSPCSLSDAPFVTISGSNTGLTDPYGIVLDSSGSIYVTK